MIWSFEEVSAFGIEHYGMVPYLGLVSPSTISGSQPRHYIVSATSPNTLRQQIQPSLASNSVLLLFCPLGHCTASS
jgi:hypothetical protein